MLLFTVSVETMIPRWTNTASLRHETPWISSFIFRYWQPSTHSVITKTTETAAAGFRNQAQNHVSRNGECLKQKVKTETSHVSLLKHQFLKTETKARITVYMINITLDTVFIYYMGCWALHPHSILLRVTVWILCRLREHFFSC